MSVMSVEIYITISCVAAQCGVFRQIVGGDLYLYILLSLMHITVIMMATRQKSVKTYRYGADNWQSVSIYPPQAVSGDWSVVMAQVKYGNHQGPLWTFVTRDNKVVIGGFPREQVFYTFARKKPTMFKSKYGYMAGYDPVDATGKYTIQTLLRKESDRDVVSHKISPQRARSYVPASVASILGI